MTTPQAWSHSALSTHDTCPRQYHHKYVLKDLPPEKKTDEQNWGTLVHKKFEDYGSREGNKLPLDLEIHLPFLDKLNEDGATADVDLVECKVALSNKPFGVCDFFDKKVPVWWRGVIDRHQVWKKEGRARIVDYKTGKKKVNWAQLAENALWIFIKYPEVNLVNAQYYWTIDQTVSKKVWARSEIDSLVQMFAPQLEAYIHSFKTGNFPPKQSGLCRGWCPVTSCQFWEPKREGHR